MWSSLPPVLRLLPVLRLRLQLWLRLRLRLVRRWWQSRRDENLDRVVHLDEGEVAVGVRGRSLREREYWPHRDGSTHTHVCVALASSVLVPKLAAPVLTTERPRSKLTPRPPRMRAIKTSARVVERQRRRAGWEEAAMRGGWAALDDAKTEALGVLGDAPRLRLVAT